MTQFIGNAMPQFTAQANDNRLRRIGVRPSATRIAGAQTPKVRAANVSSPVNYSTAWWPRSGFLGDSAVDYGAQAASFYAWASYFAPSGVNSRLGYQGVTRDVNNSPLPGATVKLFLTADDTKVTPDITSDSLSGEYVISTPYYAPHWIKVNKAGTPDVQGVSVDTIYPNV
jgi:hypothetical protein